MLFDKISRFSNKLFVKSKFKYALYGGLLLAALPGSNAHALTLEYHGFYQYLKPADSIEYSYVRPAFFLKNANGSVSDCVSDSAEIITPNASYPLVFDRISGEFFVPYDKRLKDQRARLHFGGDDHCTLAVAVAGRIASNQISADELALISTQMYELMREYAGMMKYMMPDWSAMVFHFKNGEQQAISKVQLHEGITFDRTPSFATLQMAQEN